MSRKKTAHPLRPQDQADAKIWDAAAQVTDPEIPVISDWITEQGRKDLRDYGIAPPTGKSATVNSGPIPLQIGMPSPVVCPHCGSTKTQKISHFGSTSCKALYNCQACFEPFDYFKVH